MDFGDSYGCGLVMMREKPHTNLLSSVWSSKCILDQKKENAKLIAQIPFVLLKVK